MLIVLLIGVLEFIQNVNIQNVFIWLWCGSLAILHFGLQWLLQQLVSFIIISLQQLVMAVFMLENLGLWVVTQGLILSILSQKSLRLSGTSILTQFPFIGFMFDGD